MGCACGCGTGAPAGRRFVHGHNRRGIPRSPETLAKVRATWADPGRRARWCAALGEGARRPEARAAYSRAKKGIPLTPEHRQKIGEANRGKPKSEAHRRHLAEVNRTDGPTWKVDRRDGSARAYVFAPDHPAADNRGRVCRARIVVEERLGRMLGPAELPHHINLDPTDDHPDNLMALGRREHTAFHHLIRRLGIEDHFAQWFSRAEREAATT